MRTLALVAALSGLAVAGCYYSRSPIRPVPALLVSHDAATARCLVVLVPGLGDGPDSFLETGFPEAITASGAPCDSVLVDLGYRYYFGARVADVLYEDVLVPAAARGYEEIWLVGISLGGLGVTLTARAHPELVDGVVLLSPFLGLRERIAEIGATGLDAWSPMPPLPPGEVTDARFTEFVWAWLRGYVVDPDAMPPMYVGWAAGEPLEPGARLLAGVLPDDHSEVVEGGHGWASWGVLFRRLLSRAPVGRR